MNTKQTQQEQPTLKEAVKTYIDYLIAVADNKTRWEKLTKMDGEEE